MNEAQERSVRVGIGGPVGSGKTALMDWLCKSMRGRFDIAAITNDIYTREDAEFLTSSGALPPERIRGVETGGCPHTAIREDASINLAAIAEMSRLFPALDLILIEFGRRQSGRDLFARARRSDDLRHRRCRRRQDPAQGRSRHHPLRPPGDQQDRSCPPGRRQPRSHGPRRQANARRAPLCLHQSQMPATVWTRSSISSRRKAGLASDRADPLMPPWFCGRSRPAGPGGSGQRRARRSRFTSIGRSAARNVPIAISTAMSATASTRTAGPGPCSPISTITAGSSRTARSARCFSAAARLR